MFPARIRTAFVLAAVVLGAQGCRAPDSVETVIVYLKNTETFQYRTVGGHEEGATIAVQAEHYSISEIGASAPTNIKRIVFRFSIHD